MTKKFYFLLFTIFLFNVNAKVEFDSTLFVDSPKVNYPTGIMVAPDSSAVYVSSDPNSSLSQGKNKGRVFRVVDTNNDGKADKVNLFIDVIDSPRNGFFIDNKLYLIHPPYLSVFEDTNNDGKADKKKVLVKGLGFDLNFRGADHTTNGARMAIDGWIYIAVGDYGMPAAQGTDGTKVTLHGGGLARVRPDGSELEIYSAYTRNTYDVATSSTLDFFARDNTNDGLGWNTRFHHMLPLANSGYPRLYKFFASESLAPLADYGGGSGTGMLYFQDPNWNFPNNEALLSCDFTTRKIYFHPLKKKGATYSIQQENFLNQNIRMIDLDIDGLGHLYISNWKNGKYRYSGDNVGQVFRLTPKSFKKSVFPNIKKLPSKELVNLLFSISSVKRLVAQRELLKRPKNIKLSELLIKKIKNHSLNLYGRIAAIFTFKQMYGNKANSKLGALLEDRTIKAFLLKAITDRKTQLKDINPQWYALALYDKDDRIKLEAINGLVRLQNSYYNKEILTIAKGFELPYLAKKQFQIPTQKEVYTVKSYAQKISLELNKNKTVYLNAKEIFSSNHPFIWGEPKFFTADGTIIQVNKQFITNSKGKFSTGNLPIYFTKKATQAKYGFKTTESLFLEINIPKNAVRFEVIAAPHHLWTGDYGYKISVGINNPNLNKNKENTALQHVAIQALGHLNYSYFDALKMIDISGYTSSAVATLFLAPHSSDVIEAIQNKLQSTANEDTRGLLIQVLARLYHKEQKWSLKDWWSTKPDHRGPYFTPITWNKSPHIKKIIETEFQKINNINLKKSLIERFRANRIDPYSFQLGFEEDGIVKLLNAKTLVSKDVKELVERAKQNKNKNKLIKAYDVLDNAKSVSKETLMDTRMILLCLMDKFKTNKEENTLKRQNFIYSSPHLPIEQLMQKTTDAINRNTPLATDKYLWKHIINLSVSPLIEKSTRDYVYNKVKSRINSWILNKNSFGFILEAIDFIDAKKYLHNLKSISNKPSKYKKRIQQLISKFTPKKRQIKNSELNKLLGNEKTADVMKWINTIKGDKNKGKQFALTTGCIACHTFSALEDPKGPYLGSVGAKFPKQYIIESILEPAKQVAQGFRTKKVTLKNNNIYIGFNTKTTADFFEIRTVTGQTSRIASKDIKSIEEIPGSQMPASLTASLTRQNFADFIAYLESLKSH